MIDVFNKKPKQPTVLAPDFEGVMMPVADADMAMATKIHGRTMLDAKVAEYFVLGRHHAPYMQLRQPNGKPFIDAYVDGALKRFYVFALPKTPGSTQPHDDSAYMVAVRCSITQVSAGVYSIMPEEIIRGVAAYFVMSASFVCCAGKVRGRTMLYGDTSQSKGPFLNMAFAGDNLRPEIRSVWQQARAVVLDAAGGAALARLARLLVTGGETGKPALTKAGEWSGNRATLG